MAVAMGTGGHGHEREDLTFKNLNFLLMMSQKCGMGQKKKSSRPKKMKIYTCIKRGGPREAHVPRHCLSFFYFRSTAAVPVWGIGMTDKETEDIIFFATQAIVLIFVRFLTLSVPHPLRWRRAGWVDVMTTPGRPMQCTCQPCSL